MGEDLDRKLRELVDRSEIWQVLQRYGRGLDRFDVELVKSCFFEDAVEDHDNLYLGPRDGFIDWANATASHFETCQHGLMNHYCELAGDDAYGETYFLFVAVAAQAPHVLSTGRYVDHFQRRNGEWRIANRVTIVEASFEIGEGASAALHRRLRDEKGRQPVARDTGDVSYQRPPVPRRPQAA